MYKFFKYRLHPTVLQEELLDKHFNACRFVYNLALETKQYAYAIHNKNISCFDLHAQLPDLKKECPWLKEVASSSLQQSIINLDRAFTGFFKGVAKYPNFKSKHRGSQSFRNPHGNKIKIVDSKIFIPKFKKGISIVISRPYIGVVKSATVSKTPTGKYFVSLLCETGEPMPAKPPITEGLGIDLGLKDFIVTSDGEKVENPKHLRNSMARLKVLQRRSSRKKNGSANRKKANLKVALLHERITNQRKDFLHKLSTKLVSENQALFFEDLNVKGMLKNHKLAGAISDVSWSEFVRQCQYKAEWTGKNVLFTSRWFASSKTCNECGHHNEYLTLGDRHWECECGVIVDRDVNAAKNIKDYCIRNSGQGMPAEPLELPTLVGALKQEVD